MAKNRIKLIKYQLLKGSLFNWSDRRLVEMAQSILDAEINESDGVTEEDLQSFPQTFFGNLSLTWSGDTNVIIRKDSTELSDNLTDNIIPEVPLNADYFLAVNGEVFALSDGDNLYLNDF